MEQKTEIVHLDNDFPFAIYKGRGFSPKDCQEGNAFWHNHHCLEINYVLSPGGTYFIGDDSYPIQDCDIFIINNYEYHYAVNEGSDMELFIIVFDPDLVWQDEQMDFQYIRAFYEWKEGFKHRLPGDGLANREISPILLEMEEEWNHRATGYRLVIKALLLKLLAVIYRRFESVSQYSEQILHFQNNYVRIINAINYMDEHFKEQITLKELADCIPMNPNYFSTYFGNVMNCTVSTYLIRKRLKYACLLLATSSDSITHIAIESGFQNVPYFNRTFKKYLGITPCEYREQYIHHQ